MFLSNKIIVILLKYGICHKRLKKLMKITSKLVFTVVTFRIEILHYASIVYKNII